VRGLVFTQRFRRVGAARGGRDRDQHRTPQHVKTILILRQVHELNAADKLHEAQLLAFADEDSFDKVVAALSLMCDLPLGVVERAFVQSQTEQIVVLARAIDISWATTLKLLLLHAGVNGSSRQQLDVTFANFFRLQPATARMALKFYRLREKATAPK
jgi:hypothetical protein